MGDYDGHKQRELPLTCRKGHPWVPGQVTVSSAPCDCPTTAADPRHGHLVVHCRQLGCAETWQTDADTLIGALADRSRAAADRDSSRTTPESDNPWALLKQAHEHQRSLLEPSHPAPTHIAGLRSWIQDCVKAVDEAQRLEALIAPYDGIALIEIAARIAAVVDAFQMYASMLERFRSASQTAAVLPSQPLSLAVVADDERVLLSCRAALRSSIQQLITALQSGPLANSLQ